MEKSGLQNAALVLEGGGFRGIYTTGVLDYLMEQGLYLPNVYGVSAGALNAMMSGSGPTVFGLFESRADAREAQRRIREKSLTRQVYVTSIHSVRRNQVAD